MKMSAMAFLFLSLTSPTPASSNEVDDFHNPRSIRNSAPYIDQLVNNALRRIEKEANDKSRGRCDYGTLLSALENNLGKNFTKIGKTLETRVAQFLEDEDPLRFIDFQYSSKNYSEIPLPRSSSIYRNTNINTCCANRVLINGIMIGIDKIDHFFGNGWLLWRKYETHQSRNESVKLKYILDLSRTYEHGIWGLSLTGVKSYSDLAANYNGFTFWKNILDQGIPGSKPYFACDRGRTILKRWFSIAEYVDLAWNESINCSSYDDIQTADTVKKNMMSEGFRCPMDISHCKSLKDKYWNLSSQVQQSVLSPLCLDPASAFNQVENVIDSNILNALDAAGGLRASQIFGAIK